MANLTGAQDMSESQIYERYFLTCPSDWVRGFDPLKIKDDEKGRQAVGAALLKQLNLDKLENIEVVGIPTLDYELDLGYLADLGGPPIEPPEILVVQFLITSTATRNQFLETVDALDRAEDVSVAADLMIGSLDYLDYWCPNRFGSSFGGSGAALRQIERDALNGIPGHMNQLTGDHVNIVVVDRGIDATAWPGSYISGWKALVGGQWVLPGTARGKTAEHSQMLLRIINQIAPQAKFFDMPLMPARVGNWKSFIGNAVGAFARIRSGIIDFQNHHPHWAGRWMILNAWAPFDRRTDRKKGHNSYGEDDTHPFHQRIKRLTGSPILADVVFAAGNCGQFCPDGRCGPGDIGHGRSISGANSYSEVMTVGAVRVDGVPTGYSSQGPGMIATGPEKPDLCTPAQFHDDDDPGWISSGTSAACAIAAGVVAALRTKTLGTNKTPADLITALRSSANPPDGATAGVWDTRLGPQFGCGTLDAKAARVNLNI